MNSRSIWSKDYVFLLLAVFFASFTHQAYTYMVPIYVLDIGGDNSMSGIMVMALTVSGIVTRIVCGPLIDRLGRKKILVIGAAAFAVNTVLYCFVDSIPGLLILRILNGISQGIYFPVPPTLVADLTPREKTVDAIGFFGISACISSAVAPSLGTFFYRNLGANGLFIISTVIAFISFGFTLLIKDNYVPDKSEWQKERKKGFGKISGFIELSIIIPALVSFLLYFGNSSVTNFLGPYGVSKGLENISIFFLISNISMIAVKLITGPLHKKLGLSKLIVAGLLLLAISMAIIAFADNIIYVYAAAVLFGMGVSISTQLLQVLVLETVSVKRRGVANSTFMLFGDVGLGAGASVCGAISLYFGYFAMFVFSAVIVALSIGLYLFYHQNKMKKNSNSSLT